MVRHRLGFVGFALMLMQAGSTALFAQGVDVTVSFALEHTTASTHRFAIAPVAVWLTPVQPLPPHSPEPAHPGPFRLVQKNKQFVPHLLVVPTGTSVEFPNKDPFLHNVFSLFNGKRFDLGLYESGSTRSVRFDREGVSFIFCNIHPDMGAVVLALGTPYYGISNDEGIAQIHDVPPGGYTLHVWSETYEMDDKVPSRQTVHVGISPLNLGEIHLKPAVNPMLQHKNKFGEDYLPSNETHY